jgi:hypothetical protein
MSTNYDKSTFVDGGPRDSSTSPASPWQRRLPVFAVLVTVAVLVYWAAQARAAIFVRHRTPFDDAYMFWRYAINLRDGFGLAWNQHGAATFGETSLLWGFVILLATWLPMPATLALMMASWVCSIAVPIVMAAAVSRLAASSYFKNWWLVLPLAALPLLPINQIAGTMFFRNTLTGMETMLAASLMAGFVGLALAWQRGIARPEAPALLGVLLFLTRPESAIAVVLLPALIGLCMGGCTRSGILRLYLVYAAGVVATLLLCRLYFGTAFPLGFYVKSAHAYEGYRISWHPMRQLTLFLRSSRPYLLVLGLLARGSDWRLILACLLPATAVFVYLGTVNQIMGFQARYYLPYLAFFAIPALLILDRRLVNPGRERLWSPRAMLVHAAIAFAVLLPLRAEADATSFRNRIASHLEPAVWEYDPVLLNYGPARQLPLTPQNAITDHFIARLPAGTLVAASEVGYLGSASPRVDILDLEGLNDTHIALHGFTMADLLARRPDVIWLPHVDYTWQRGVMLTAPVFLAQYDVFAEALGFGIALRKDSPFHAQIDTEFRTMWSELYAGYPLEDYRVRSTSWTGQKHLVPPTTECDVCK